MSLGSVRNNIAFELAPHQLSNSVYSSQGSISPYLVPSASYPIVYDSVKYPAVDGQFKAYYDTPRVMGSASNSIGIYSGYRQFQSLEPNVPSLVKTNLPPLGRPMPYTVPINYYGCSQAK